MGDVTLGDVLDDAVFVHEDVLFVRENGDDEGEDFEALFDEGGEFDADFDREDVLVMIQRVGRPEPVEKP